MKKELLLLLLAIFLVSCKKKVDNVPGLDEVIHNNLSTDEEFSKQLEEDNGKVNNYQEFVSKSYATVFNQKVNSGSFVYSPYSYKMALEGLGKTTDYFKGMDYFGYGVEENLKKNLENLISKNMIILNKAFLDSKNPEFKLASFKEEAEELSKKLQEEVLGKVILNPNYEDEGIMSVIVNATKFKAKWEEPFDKSFTQEHIFTCLDGKLVKKEMMFGDIDALALDNEEVSVGRKALEGEGYVYFIAPKKHDLDSLQKIAGEIPAYIARFSDYIDRGQAPDIKLYDEVNLEAPKFSISSEIDLLDSEMNAGRSQIVDEFDFNDQIDNKSGQKAKISRIFQVANMMIDEVEIKAEAVTEIFEKIAASRSENILNITCDRPHFVVSVSDGIVSFIAFIGK